MLTELSRLQTEAAKPRRRDPELIDMISRYRSHEIPERMLPQVRPFMREVLEAADLEGTESKRKHCTHVAFLAHYALNCGRTLTIADVLTTAFIDEYVRNGMKGSSDHLRLDRRRRLLGLARRVNPGPTTPMAMTPIGHVSVKPCYTPTELAAIVRSAWVQPTPALKRQLALIVSLGAGAGLDSPDLRYLWVRHIQDRGAKGIWVDVQGPRPRIVVVRQRYEELLRSALDGRGPDELAIGKVLKRRNITWDTTNRAALYQVPHIEQSRLRASWLADLMTDSVPIGVILKAAGLKSARTLIELLPHLGPWLAYKGLDADDPDGILRGGAA